MCGIAGILHLSDQATERRTSHEKVLQLLRHRGPDSQAFKQLGTCTLYHSRLEIIDTTQASNQPFMSDSGQQALVFNGEIFNYKTLQEKQGAHKTSGDTEVLLRALLAEGKECLNTLNGFFAFAFYNAEDASLLLARDRMGVKPLYYYQDDDRFMFASELKPLLELAGPQELNHDQLYTYLRLNYCAGAETIFKNVYRLLPGQCIEIKNQSVKTETWYRAPKQPVSDDLGMLLDDAIQLRLQADVPVGTFLSGGLDSSIISALAKKHKPGLNTFSIGFEREHYFDETRYSELVANHIQSNHHVFRLKEEDFLQHLDAFLASIDEPFADSSAFNFYMLSLYTRQHVKVALSGDGADELFKGYNKHRALLLNNSAVVRLAARLTAGLAPGSGSRQGKIKNALRQLHKLHALSGLSPAGQQKLLASISSHETVEGLLEAPHHTTYFDALFRSGGSLREFKPEDTVDLQTVLADDMLVKADRFSMQHGIEIRNPFLDYRVVEFALNLPIEQKLNRNEQKIILRNTFRQLLPAEIFERSKKGFELPLRQWLSGALRPRLETEWLNNQRIKDEGLLNAAEIKQLVQKLFSTQPGDSAAQVWALVVFQSWLLNFKDYIKH